MIKTNMSGRELFGVLIVMPREGRFGLVIPFRLQKLRKFFKSNYFYRYLSIFDRAIKSKSD